MSWRTAHQALRSPDTSEAAHQWAYCLSPSRGRQPHGPHIQPWLHKTQKHTKYRQKTSLASELKPLIEHKQPHTFHMSKWDSKPLSRLQDSQLAFALHVLATWDMPTTVSPALTVCKRCLNLGLVSWTHTQPNKKQTQAEWTGVSNLVFQVNY